jgi:pyridoxine 5-phosphate synthase
VDHVATLRQARGGAVPDPVAAAALAELHGADQVTVHLREDRRHIQDRDLEILSRTVKTRLNLEMAATGEMVSIALALRPRWCTLVPERRQELTTEGGLDVAGRLGSGLGEAVARLRGGGIRVSLFVDPETAQVGASREAGADAVELHTGGYAAAFAAGEHERELSALAEAAAHGRRLGLRVFAGHGLDLRNIVPVLAIEEIEEYNIGHSIVAHALFAGLPAAVREMADLVHGAPLTR